jgi:hypothetical protein
MKTVIFVGGTSYSGSTLLDMILSNDPRGFSCGEVYAMFWPYSPRHVKPVCMCGTHNCGVWETARTRGEEHVYETIFQYYPETDFIVDSSKDVFWIEAFFKSILQHLFHNFTPQHGYGYTCVAPASCFEAKSKGMY